MTRADELAEEREREGSARDLLVERLGRELHVHCYRMLGSYADADDLVRETLRRAGLERAPARAGPSERARLYRITTGACLETIEHTRRRAVHTGAHAFAPSDVPWLQPYPDDLLDGVARETIELAFVAVLQLLPPKQRAVLILRDVLGWAASEVATVLGASAAAINSALQRARATMYQHRPDARFEWVPALDPIAGERALLRRYVDAHERVDVAAVVELLDEQVRCTMPPHPMVYEGRAEVARFFEQALESAATGDLRLVPTAANRQLAVAHYLRARDDGEYRALALDVLKFEHRRLAEITTFEPHVFAGIGLPEAL